MGMSEELILATAQNINQKLDRVILLLTELVELEKQKAARESRSS